MLHPHKQVQTASVIICHFVRQERAHLIFKIKAVCVYGLLGQHFLNPVLIHLQILLFFTDMDLTKTSNTQ